MGNLLVVGSVAYDEIETAVEKREQVLGGSATFFSCAASYFCGVNLVAVIGEDFQDADLEQFRSREIDLKGLKTIKGGRTFRWGGEYNEDFSQRKTHYTDLNVFKDFKPEIPEDYKNTDLVFLANIDPGLQINVLNQVPDAKFVACDTMNFWISGKPRELHQLLKRVDALIINDEEAFQLSKTKALVHAAKVIQEMGPRTLIIKRGEHGAFLFHDREIFYAPAYPLEGVKDPTGAGDTFAGGFMGYLSRTMDLSADNMRRAVIVGSLMASYAVEDFALGKLGTLNQKQIINRYRAFQELTRFKDLVL